MASPDQKTQILSLLDTAYKGRINNVKQSIVQGLEALALSRGCNEQELVGKSLNHISLFYMIVGENQLSLDASHEAIACFTKLQDEQGIADAKFNMGSVNYKTNNYHSGLISLVDCLSIYKKYNDYSKQARVHKTLGAIYEFIGDENNAFTSYHHAIDAARDAGDLNMESNAYNPLSGIYLNRNNTEKAIELIERSISIKTQTGDIRGLAFAFYGRGKIHTHTKQFDAAENDFKEAERIHLEMGEKLGLAMTYYKMGVLAMAMSDLPNAISVLEKGRALSDRHNITQFKFKCDYQLYQVYRQMGEKEKALFHLEQYLKLKETVINTETLKVIENYDLISKQQLLENSELLEAKEQAEITNRALHKSQAILKRTQKIGNLGSWVLYADKPNIEWSDEAYILFGVPTGLVTFDDIFACLHDQDKAKVMQEWTAALHGKPYDLEYRIVANGAIKWIHATGEFEFDANGTFKSAIGIVKDITSHKADVENLRTSKEQAEKANRAKSEFLSNMSHEIRTPLNGVIGFTDLLMGSKLDDLQRQYITTANQSAHALLSIINDVLDFSKIEAGKFELVQERIDLNGLGRQVLDMVSHQAKKKNIKLNTLIGDALPPYIWTDAVRLRQVLVNLMGNAIKFTNEGEIDLTVETINCVPENYKMPEDGLNIPDAPFCFRFSVKDTGIGIKAENQAKIFEAFVQEDSYTTKKYGGTGLGLNISNKLLALMGSHLQLHSVEGKGSTFYFDVCFKAGHTNLETPESPLTIKEDGFPLVKSLVNASLKILIAEDNPVNMTLVKIILKRELPDAMLIEAVNGNIAVDLFLSEHPHLVLMDVQMPEMNGYEAAVEIRKIEKSRQLAVSSRQAGEDQSLFPPSGVRGSVPIIAITAGTVKGEKEKCMKAGMDDYISKPIVAGTVEAVLKKWLVTQTMH